MSKPTRSPGLLVFRMTELVRFRGGGAGCIVTTGRGGGEG